jgi:hypothetical protein
MNKRLGYQIVTGVLGVARKLQRAHLMLSPWMSKALPWFVVVSSLLVLTAVAFAPR